MRTGGKLAATALAAALAACGCGGGDEPKPPPSPSSPAPATSTAAKGNADLLRAGDAALAKVPDGTLISIETERNGDLWEVQVTTPDGTERQLDVRPDGTVADGPTTKREDAADKAKHRDRAKAAKIDFRQAVQRVERAAPGQITELNLDGHRGRTVWEADVRTANGTKAVKLDASTGEVVQDGPA